MKKFTLLACLGTVALLATGCSTVVTPPNVAVVLRGGSSFAVNEGISKDTNAIPYIRAAGDIICSMSSQTNNLTPADIEDALQASNVQQLSTPIADLVVNTVVGLYDANYEQWVQTQVGGNVWLQTELTALCQGINDGLSSPPAFMLKRHLKSIRPR